MTNTKRSQGVPHDEVMIVIAAMIGATSVLFAVNDLRAIVFGTNLIAISTITILVVSLMIVITGLQTRETWKVRWQTLKILFFGFSIGFLPPFIIHYSLSRL